MKVLLPVSMKSFIPAFCVLAIVTITISQAAVPGVKWDKNLGKFKSILEVPGYDIAKQRHIFSRSQQSQQNGIHNFNGSALRIVYYQDPGFFEFYDNDTKATGICGDVWSMLSTLLNFTIVLKKIEKNPTGGEYANGIFRKLVRYIQCNKADVIPKIIFSRRLLGVVKYTPVLWVNRQRIFVHAHWKGNRSWMFETFSEQVWTRILVFIIMLSVASNITQRVLINNNVLDLRNRSYSAHLFYTFASLCNQANTPDNAGSGSRILTFTISMFSWIILAAYSSCLINDMTEEIIDSPFKDLIGLFENTRLQILVLSGSFTHVTLTDRKTPKVLRHIVSAKRISIESNLDDLYSKVCLHPDKFVLFYEEDAVTTRNTTYCNLFPVDVPGFSIFITSAIRNNFQYKKSLDIGIIKLHEFGVINEIKNRYMKFKSTESEVKQTTRLFIDFDRVSIIFAILSIGILASIIICVIENVVFKL